MSQTNESSVTWSNLGPELLDRTPRYLIYFLIFYAPFCYGLRDGVGEEFFVSVAFIAFFIHCWKCYLDDRWPRVPGWLLFCMSLIALQGLWMCLNADSYHRWHRELIVIRIFLSPPPFPELPGSRDLMGAAIQFLPVIAIFCLIQIVIDVSERHRRRILLMAAASAVMLALTGIVMKFGGRDLLTIYWDLRNDSDYRTVFASFRNHGNAASFLMMGLAIAIGHSLQAYQDRARLARILGTFGAAVLYFAIFFNTSRAGWILTLLLTVLFAPQAVRILRGPDQDSSTTQRWLSLGISVFAISTMIMSLLFSDISFRLGRLSEVGTAVTKRLPLQLFLKMVDDTPALGFGPGTFAYVFPKYQLADPDLVRQDRFLNEAHNDYFQTFFDWGPIGAFSFLLILAIPLIAILRSGPSKFPNQIALACLFGVTTVLTQAGFDFPLQVTSVTFMFGILIAYLIGQFRWDGTNRPSKTQAPRRINNGARNCGNHSGRFN